MYELTVSLLEDITAGISNTQARMEVATSRVKQTYDYLTGNNYHDLITR
jgi:hypothetical protein